MIIMTLLKVIFTVLLCLPLVYIMFHILVNLIDEFMKMNPKKTRKQRNNPDRRNVL